MENILIDELKYEYERLSRDGFRACDRQQGPVEPPRVTGAATPYTKADECDLILNGYVAFLMIRQRTALLPPFAYSSSMA